MVSPSARPVLRTSMCHPMLPLPCVPERPGLIPHAMNVQQTGTSGSYQGVPTSEPEVAPLL